MLTDDLRLERRRRQVQARRLRQRAALGAGLALIAVLAGVVALAPSGGTPGKRGEQGTEPPAGQPSLNSTERGPRRLERLVVGRGARGALVLRPEGRQGSQPGVVLFHGWREAVREYEPWARHLARRGNVVILPRYQDLRSRPDRVLGNALAGIRAALAEAPIAPGSLVTAGHSAGGALAADYAATTARGGGIPPAAGIFAVYPGRAILGFPGGVPAVDPGGVSPDTAVLVLSSANDRVVGQAPARELLESFSTVPRSRRRLVRVTDSESVDHYAPERTDRDARRAFWKRLDSLIAASRG